MTRIPPRDQTVMRMHLIELRIRTYWDEHGTVPAKLEDLPPLQKRDNAITDGWGKPIQYAVTQPAEVTLTSLSDAAVRVRFHADDPNRSETTR